MKRAFITVRFDRMQNMDLRILCKNIISCLEKSNTEQLQLNASHERFKKIVPLLDNLTPKRRKLPHTNTIMSLRKRQEELVTALLLHVKAIERAAFEDQMHDLLYCKNLLRKLFKKFVHQGIATRNTSIIDLETVLKTEADFRNAVISLGLLRYIDTISELKKQIESQTTERNIEKGKQPQTGVTIPSKEEVISELRFLLQSIDVTAATHNENDYTLLIREINEYLTEDRAQLRNLTSRRKTAKEKAKKKKEDVG